MYHKVLYSSAGIATQILVRTSEFLILLDVGDGIIRDLVGEIKLPLSIPIHLFLSHGHFDHCGGLFSLLGFLRMLGQKHKVGIYYPKGTKEIRSIIELFNSSYKDSIPFEMITIKLNPNAVVEIDEDIKVKAYRMKHHGSTLVNGMLPEIPALGYAIWKKGKKIIAYTGDTGMNENLLELISGADHAYIEATLMPDKELPHHLSETQAHELGKLAKNYTLVHCLKKK